MKLISAKIFSEIFIEFVQKKLESEKNSWSIYYNKSSQWTKFILSSGSQIEIENLIKKKTGLIVRSRKEDGLVDLTMTVGKDLEKIPTLNKNYEHVFLEFKDSVTYEPRIYDVLLEHENYIYDSWREVAKLAYQRARLKVLVTYIYKEGREKEECEMMIKTFNTIIKQCTEDFEDNPKTEYLLLIGYQDGRKNLRWYEYIFDSKGNAILS